MGLTDSAPDPDAFNAFEAAGWNAKVMGYDDFFGQITPRLVAPLLDAAEVGSGVRVLDVASGPGYAAARAAERGASVVGVDISQEMLTLARRLHPQVDFRLGDAEALTLPDGSFDAVVGNFLLHHVGRPEQAAGEFARVLAPGGRLALTVWDLPERARFIGVVLDAAAHAGAHPPADVPVGPPFFRFSDEHGLTGLLAGGGFGDVHVETVAFTHEVPSPDHLWRGLLAGTVRTSALVLGQSEGVQREIRAGFERGVQEFRVDPTGRDPRLEMPVSVKLASASNPSRSLEGRR